MQEFAIRIHCLAALMCGDGRKMPVVVFSFAMYHFLINVTPESERRVSYILSSYLGNSAWHLSLAAHLLYSVTPYIQSRYIHMYKYMHAAVTFLLSPYHPLLLYSVHMYSYIPKIHIPTPIGI